MPGTRSGQPTPSTFTCPNCGADVKRGAASCPACGSDDATGWSEGADHWEADIPVGYGDDNDFDYDAFVKREFSGESLSAAWTTAKRLLAWVPYVAIVLWLLFRLWRR